MHITKRNRCNGRPARAGSWGAVSNESGSALIVTLVVLVVLTLLGVIATRNTQSELRISAADKLHRITFYDADGATELASELLEQNIEQLAFNSSVAGFHSDTNSFGFIDIDTNTGAFDGLVGIANTAFWQNIDDVAYTPTDTDRDFFLPSNAGAGDPHTNFKVGGHPEFMAGSSLPMAAGYEGLGKKSGSGGTMNVYEIITQRVGQNDSESTVRVQWRHIN